MVQEEYKQIESKQPEESDKSYQLGESDKLLKLCQEITTGSKNYQKRINELKESCSSQLKKLLDEATAKDSPQLEDATPTKNSGVTQKNNQVTSAGAKRQADRNWQQQQLLKKIAKLAVLQSQNQPEDLLQVFPLITKQGKFTADKKQTIFQKIEDKLLSLQVKNPEVEKQIAEHFVAKWEKQLRKFDTSGKSAEIQENWKFFKKNQAVLFEYMVTKQNKENSQAVALSAQKNLEAA
jgi:hypothetical protein